MALGQWRQVFRTEIGLSVSGVAERGGIISYDPVQAGNGIYANAAAISGALSQPAGLLLEDIEDMNFFKHGEWLQRNVSAKGSVVGLGTEVEGYTDFVETTLAGITVGTYAAGDPLYLADDGKVSRNNGTFGNVAATARRVRVGTALSTIDSDGFLKVRIEL